MQFNAYFNEHSKILSTIEHFIVLLAGTLEGALEGAHGRAFTTRNHKFKSLM